MKTKCNSLAIIITVSICSLAYSGEKHLIYLLNEFEQCKQIICKVNDTKKELKSIQEHIHKKTYKQDMHTLETLLFEIKQHRNSLASRIVKLIFRQYNKSNMQIRESCSKYLPYVTEKLKNNAIKKAKEAHINKIIALLAKKDPKEISKLNKIANTITSTFKIQAREGSREYYLKMKNLATKKLEDIEKLKVFFNELEQDLNDDDNKNKLHQNLATKLASIKPKITHFTEIFEADNELAENRIKNDGDFKGT